MDQTKIGKYIKEKRKSMSLTQRELADKLNISDKTISKWECGNGMPDFNMLNPLCDVLGISVNELLAGEDISSDTYAVKAEENIMSLIKENENQKKNRKWNIAAGIIALVMAGVLFASEMHVTGVNIGHYFDVISFAYIALICGMGVFFSRASGKKEVLLLIKKMVIPAGAMVTLLGVILTLCSEFENIHSLMMNLSVSIISLLYSLIVYLILVPICYKNQ